MEALFKPEQSRLSRNACRCLSTFPVPEILQRAETQFDECNCAFTTRDRNFVRPIKCFRRFLGRSSEAIASRATLRRQHGNRRFRGEPVKDALPLTQPRASSLYILFLFLFVPVIRPRKQRTDVAHCFVLRGNDSRGRQLFADAPAVVGGTVTLVETWVQCFGQLRVKAAALSVTVTWGSARSGLCERTAAH